MAQVLSLRLVKVKEKKEGQLIGYFKKFFENVEDEKKKKVVESEGNIISYFLSLMLEFLMINPKYDKYLQHIRAKRDYAGKMQINKVISNFQAKR